MKILIDTNIYLDFYRSNKEALALFDELIDNVDKIILTDQIIMEFDRSREKIIREVSKAFENESKLDNFSSSYLNDLKEFKELLEIQKKYKEKKSEVKKRIDEILVNPEKDPIAEFFKEFINKAMKEGIYFTTTDEIIAKARQRKFIGNPPTSNKFSLGDEINWEIILVNATEDIVIVGRDNTYTENFSFLKKDFHKSTGLFINNVTDSITSALKIVGVKADKGLEGIEKTQIDEIKHYSSFWKSTSL